ncbi:glycosyltransferase family 1 protein [Bacteroides helcogenes]|uniref:Glycosyl transferase group 1 n=1 Tax=Bacteroides helcogenes (strain ATCC 35417 / DSM 20613 / JCM 6297 / CCUG 15421 / P 36-108) TaxID=693979 RepID=E6SW43_BACT6|nr:glycosyltransferase family 1 protein [Bacteroides helcogenes]ADV42568.1 glycosyl transferase group 1 [Bacteroides helcogenes P 36-108]MDY5237671.1 glycosyltransferase family 1 protein [Bacteroides helcogenes]
MRIGFDAKRAAQNRTGLGNYSRFVIESLIKYAPDEHYLLYTPNPKKTSCIGETLLQDNTEICYPHKIFWQKFRSLWRVWGITSDLEKDDIHLFHGLSNELPLNIRTAQNIRSIVTVHDLIFLRYPEYYPYIDRKIYAYKFRKACLNADRIIAISECTKRDIINFFRIPEEKIDVVYQGCDDSFKQAVSLDKREVITRKYQLPAKYILYVGSIEERKNLMVLAQALPFLTKDVQIIAVGKRTPYAGKVESFLRQEGLQHRMKLISNVPFEDLPALYQMASTFVYPSKFEGFGIPLLEALNSGTPAIGATGSCLEEAGGPHTLYVNPSNARELAETITRTLTDSILRERMIAEGKKYALNFEAEKIAKEIIRIYKKVMKQ